MSLKVLVLDEARSFSLIRRKDTVFHREDKFVLRKVFDSLCRLSSSGTSIWARGCDFGRRIGCRGTSVRFDSRDLCEYRLGKSEGSSGLDLDLRDLIFQLSIFVSVR